MERTAEIRYLLLLLLLVVVQEALERNHTN
jgi:hypothetical protein